MCTVCNKAAALAVDGAAVIQSPQEYDGELEAGVETSVGLTCGVKGSSLTVVELATATPNNGGVDGSRKVDNMKMLLSGQSIEKLTMKRLTTAQTETRAPQTDVTLPQQCCSTYLELPLQCDITAVCRTNFAAEKGNIAAVDVKLPLQRH
ncbi:hypothetical protein C8R45DRAFT_931937 [Mycena sanguinolenta]|nr:hypothetical protein C8R45DRAFT_931937 [Mycena sanguinolenta]